MSSVTKLRATSSRPDVTGRENPTRATPPVKPGGTARRRATGIAGTSCWHASLRIARRWQRPKPTSTISSPPRTPTAISASFRRNFAIRAMASCGPKPASSAACWRMPTRLPINDFTALSSAPWIARSPGTRTARTSISRCMTRCTPTYSNPCTPERVTGSTWISRCASIANVPTCENSTGNPRSATPSNRAIWAATEPR